MTRLDEIIINSKVGREWLIKYIKENNPDLYNLVIQKQNKEFKYIPNIGFGGRYECFSKIKEENK